MAAKIKSEIALKNRVKTGLFMAAMMGPAVIGFLVFYVYVNANSLVMAFESQKEEGVYDFSNFIFIFNEIGNSGSYFTGLIKNTLLFFGLGLVQMFISLLIAYFVYKQIAGYKVFRFIYYMPAIIMSTATAKLFEFVTMGDGGPISLLYTKMFGGMMPDLWAPETGTGNLMLAIYIMLFGLGPNMVLFLGSMTNISPEIFEAARIDGVGWVREIFQLIIPLIWPTFSVMFLQAVTGLTQASGPVYILPTQTNNDVHTISFYMFNSLMSGENWQRSSALGWCCTLITFPLAMLTKNLLNKVEEKIGG
jgi:multiple sugar transport system permease protein